MLVPDTSQAPPQPIAALGAVESLMDGRVDLLGVTVAPDGTLYVADRGAGIVYRRLLTGEVAPHVTGLDHPGGLALDPEGRLLVVEERAGRVLRQEASGTLAVVASGIKTPRWITVAPDGSLYISAHRLEAVDGPDDTEGREIVRLSPEGTLDVVASGIRQLQGLVVQGSQLIAASKGLESGAASSGMLLRYPIRNDGSLGSPAPWLDTGLKQPRALAIDRSSVLYVSSKEVTDLDDPARRAIGKVRADDRLTAFAHNLDDPNGIAFGPDGALYVADGTSGRVLKFVAPPRPTLTSAFDFTRQPTLAIAGTAQPGSRVDVIRDDLLAGTAIADGTGAFTASVSLARNTENQLAIVATGHGGDGLAGLPEQTRTVHDDLMPQIRLLAPLAGAHVRQALAVRAASEDTGSGVQSIAIAVDARAATSVTNPDPGEPFVATATLDTATIADGVHTLSATATDRAGNIASTSIAVVADNTQPDTTITGAPGAMTSGSTATFVFTGADDLTPVASLAFAWRLDGAGWSGFSRTASATLANLSQGSHTFEVKARDLAGNEDPTPASRSFAVGGLRVTITDPAAGAAIAPGFLVVRGTVDGADAQVAVSVNGVVAAVHGQAFAAQVPVFADTTALTATATILAGPTGTHEIAVSIVPSGGVTATLVASPRSGVAPLTVQFTLSGVVPAIVSLDLDGDGAADFTGTTLAGQRFTYAQPGLHVARVTIRDVQGAEFSASTVVLVESPVSVTSRFQALWAAFRARLGASDVPGALAYLSPKIHTDFQRVFQDLGSDLAPVAAALEDLFVLQQSDDLAEAAIVRNRDGQSSLYFVYFRRDALGQWVIEEM
jgi:sugar lactone lactonase YvrE